MTKRWTLEEVINVLQYDTLDADEKDELLDYDIDDLMWRLTEVKSDIVLANIEENQKRQKEEAEQSASSNSELHGTT